MRTLYAIQGGLAGAAAITLVHESIKRVVPRAPRMDLLGMSALEKGLDSMGARVTNEQALYVIAMTGDLLSNALYYSMAGLGRKDNALVRGAALGLAAGLGAVLLPPALGLSSRYSARTTETKLMTIGLYTLGGIVAAGVMKFLDRHKRQRIEEWEQRLVTSSMA